MSARTGAIGQIAMGSWERFKGGQRVEFVCGGALARVRFQQLRDTSAASLRLLSVLPGELPGAIERLQGELKEQKRILNAVQVELAKVPGAHLGGIRRIAADGGASCCGRGRRRRPPENAGVGRCHPSGSSPWCWCHARHRRWPWPRVPPTSACRATEIVWRAGDGVQRPRWRASLTWHSAAACTARQRPFSPPRARCCCRAAESGCRGGAGLPRTFGFVESGRRPTRRHAHTAMVAAAQAAGSLSDWIQRCRSTTTASPSRRMT